MTWKNKTATELIGLGNGITLCLTEGILSGCEVLVDDCPESLDVEQFIKSYIRSHYQLDASFPFWDFIGHNIETAPIHTSKQKS